MTELLDVDAGKHTETFLYALDQIHTQLFENFSALYHIKKQYRQLSFEGEINLQLFCHLCGITSLVITAHMSSENFLLIIKKQ